VTHSADSVHTQTAVRKRMASDGAAGRCACNSCLPMNGSHPCNHTFGLGGTSESTPYASWPFWVTSDVASAGPQSGFGAPPLVDGRTLVVKDVLSSDDKVVTLYFGSVLDVDMQTWTLHKWKIGDSESHEWWIFPRRRPTTPAADLKHWLAQNVSAACHRSLADASHVSTQ